MCWYTATVICCCLHHKGTGSVSCLHFWATGGTALSMLTIECSLTIAVLTGLSCTAQAADAIAGAAEGHAHDDEFDSPYIQEALRQGMDISIWDKLKGIKFRGGRLQLGRLTVTKCLLLADAPL